MSVQLQQGHKAIIRDLTEEAISNGLSDQELRRMRADLADSLGVSRRSLGSVSAYVEYSATEAIRDAGIGSSLSNSQLITVARLVRESGTPHADIDILAADLGLCPAELSRVVALYEEYYQGRPDGSLDVQSPVPLQKSPVCSESPTQTATPLFADPGTGDGNANATSSVAVGPAVETVEGATGDTEVPKLDIAAHSCLAPEIPLDPADKPIVYAAILRGVFARTELSETKGELRAEFGCSRSAVDGVHAQFSKDLSAAWDASPDVQQWGDPESVLRLAVRNIGAQNRDDDWEPLPGIRDFVEAFGVTCHRRGVGILWEQMTGGTVTFGTVVNSRCPAEYRGAAHSDFDFPAKIEWRRAWEDYLTRHLASLSSDERSQLRVLCLPSKDPRRELPIYLRLGIRPDNICAVEGDPEAAAELARNLKFLDGGYESIRVIPSDLLKFLKRTRDTFDIISLDFHGCAGFDKVETIRHVRVAPRHHVLLNLEAAREKHLGQQLLLDTHDMRTYPIQNMERRIARGSRQISAEQEHETIFQRPEPTLDDMRDHGLDIATLGHGHWTERSSLAGRLRHFEDLFSMHGALGNAKFPHIVSPQAELNYFASEASAALGRIVHDQLVDRTRSTQTSAELAHEFYFTYQAVVHNPPNVLDLERYGYQSEASQAHHTYLSSFASLGPTAPIRSSTRAVAAFLVEYAIRLYEQCLAAPEATEIANQGIAVLERRSRNGHVLLQAFHYEPDGRMILEGPVLSSAEITSGLDDYLRMNLPQDVRKHQLFARPRIFLGTQPDT